MEQKIKPAAGLAGLPVKGVPDNIRSRNSAELLKYHGQQLTKSSPDLKTKAMKD